MWAVHGRGNVSSRQQCWPALRWASGNVNRGDKVCFSLTFELLPLLVSVCVCLLLCATSIDHFCVFFSTHSCNCRGGRPPLGRVYSATVTFWRVLAMGLVNQDDSPDHHQVRLLGCYTVLLKWLDSAHSCALRGLHVPGVAVTEQVSYCLVLGTIYNTGLCYIVGWVLNV